MPPLSRSAAALLLALWLPAALAAPGYVVYESGEDFGTVMDAAKLAIQERGMFINQVMHLGDMLDRTGKDLGLKRKIYEQADSIQFCSAILSRKMLAEDPARIVNCPFVLAVYTLPGRPGKTYIAHRAIPPEVIAHSPAMAEIAAMLDQVAKAAASW
jgi:hypothetical protein